MIAVWQAAGACIMVCLVYLLSVLLGFFGGSQFREKNSPYECGFEPIGGARSAFSLRFFLLAMVFLIFDVEIILLLPIIGEVAGGAPLFGGVFQGFVFLFILLIGLWFEWNEGSLEWL